LTWQPNIYIFISYTIVPRSQNFKSFQTYQTRYFIFFFFFFFISVKTMRIATLKLSLCLLIVSLYPLSLTARPFILILSQEDIKETTVSSDDSPDPTHPDSPEWDEFGESDSPHKSEDELDPGSWRPILEPGLATPAAGSADPGAELEGRYSSGVSKMFAAVSSGDARVMEEAAAEIEAAGSEGHAHARSVLGFLYGMGMMRETNKAKAFLYHHFAAEGGNAQSKMALAYTYLRQDVSGP
jgi:SEL1 protein